MSRHYHRSLAGLLAFAALALGAWTPSPAAENPGVAGTPAKPYWGGELPSPPRPAWMQTDPGLQAQVKVQAAGRPLGTVLAALAAQTGMDVRASRALQDYRVSLAVGPVPLGQFMGRLQDLFGHGTLPARGYYWDRTADDKGTLHYLLIRNAQGVREEAEMLDSPLRTAEHWLREMRDYGQLPPNKRKTFKTDWRDLQSYIDQDLGLSTGMMGPFGEVYRTLNDAQITTLLQQGHVTVPITLSLDVLNTLRQEARVSQASSVPQSALATASPPTEATLGIEQGPFAEGDFDLSVSFGPNFPGYLPYGDELDTLNQFPKLTDVDALEKAQKQEKGPTVDLLAHEKVAAGKYITTGLPLALDLLAREARIPIYAEVFPRRPQTLPATRGKPEYLLSQICRVYNCDWRKVGGDYLVYSRRWAQDRAADIPQPLLDRWAASREKNGRYTLSDLLEMGRLTDRQFKTLQDMTDFLILSGNRDALRFLASLSLLQLVPGDSPVPVDSDFSIAFQPDGVELGSLDADQAALLPRLLGLKPGEGVVPPLRLKLVQGQEGVTIKLADQLGTSRDYYLYQAAVSPRPAASVRSQGAASQPPQNSDPAPNPKS